MLVTMEETDFDGKVVIVTGSSSGIGAATALAFYRLGACVTLTSFDALELETVKQQCEKERKGQKDPLLIVGDITKDEVIERIVNETLNAFGRIDILINNAGCAKVGNTESTKMEDFDYLYTLLMRAPFYLTKLAIPHLIKTKGCIINTSSNTAERPNSKIAAYSMCKAALNSFTKCLAMDLGPKGVRANAICPGYIATNIVHQLGIPEEKKEEWIQSSIDINLLDRGGRPEEVAELMVFLASEKASYMTGACLPLDGGCNCRQPGYSDWKS